MSRKTTKAGLAAIAASLLVILFGADGSGANAQVTETDDNETVDTAVVTEDIVPLGHPVQESPAAALATEGMTFLSRPVVQPLPANEAGDIAASDRRSDLRSLVAHTPLADAMSEQMRCLAGAVYFESRGEPLAGQLAVAQVIINRADSNRFPASYCGVVFQRSQFSFVRNGRMPQIKTSSGAWKRARAIAKIAHEGLWDSEAADSLYFHAKYVKPRWSRTKLARATINTHIFYR